MSRGTSHSAGAAGPQPRGGSGSSALAKGGATLRKQLQPPLPVVPCVELTGTATSQNETTSSLRNHFWLSRPTVGLFKRSLEPIKSQYRGTSSPISNSRWGRSTADSRYSYKRRKCGGKSDEGPRGPISHIALEHTGAIGLRGRKPLASGADQSEKATSQIPMTRTAARFVGSRPRRKFAPRRKRNAFGYISGAADLRPPEHWTSVRPRSLASEIRRAPRGNSDHKRSTRDVHKVLPRSSGIIANVRMNDVHSCQDTRRIYRKPGPQHAQHAYVRPTRPQQRASPSTF